MTTRKAFGGECKHGLAKEWCASCKGDLTFSRGTYVPPDNPCLSPGCRKEATRRVSTIQLCDLHWGKLEKAWIVRESRQHAPGGDPRRTYGEGAWIYFIMLGEVMKIGVTENPFRRFRSFSLVEGGVHCVSFEWGDRNLERRLHTKFKAHKAEGFSSELFHPAKPILDYIATKRRCAYCGKRAMPDRVVCLVHEDEVEEVENLIGKDFTRSVADPKAG